MNHDRFVREGSSAEFDYPGKELLRLYSSASILSILISYRIQNTVPDSNEIRLWMCNLISLFETLCIWVCFIYRRLTDLGFLSQLNVLAHLGTVHTERKSTRQTYEYVKSGLWCRDWK